MVSKKRMLKESRIGIPLLPPPKIQASHNFRCSYLSYKETTRYRGGTTSTDMFLGINHAMKHYNQWAIDLCPTNKNYKKNIGWKITSNNQNFEIPKPKVTYGKKIIKAFEAEWFWKLMSHIGESKGN